MINNLPIKFITTDGNVIIAFDDGHSHADILRYVISDIGLDDTKELFSVIYGEICEQEQDDLFDRKLA